MQLLRIKFTSDFDNRKEARVLLSEMTEDLLEEFPDTAISSQEVYNSSRSYNIFFINVELEEIEQYSLYFIKFASLYSKNNTSFFFEPLLFEKDISNFKNSSKFSGQHSFINF